MPTISVLAVSLTLVVAEALAATQAMAVEEPGQLRVTGLYKVQLLALVEAAVAVALGLSRHTPLAYQAQVEAG